MKLFTYQDDVVVDPFSGSGTTAFVAKALGRGVIGIDLSPLCCKTARHRLAKLDSVPHKEWKDCVVRTVYLERTDGQQGLKCERVRAS